MKIRMAIAAFLTCCALPMVAQLPSVPGSVPGDPVHAPHPQVVSLMVSSDTVSDLHLRPNFVTTIRMPEAVRDVIVGSPTLFLAEHSERDPELVTVKPITEQDSVSNLFIATQSGQQVSLRLISAAKEAGPDTGLVDFVLLYRHRREFLIPSDDDVDEVSSTPQKPRVSPLDTIFETQQRIASPAWDTPRGINTKPKIAAAVGTVVPDQTSMIVAFSVLNQGDRWIELLPPQVELRNPGDQAGGRKKKKKKSDLLDDQLPVSDYRFAARRLAPGARADGVVRFERPAFKQQAEQLALQLTTSDAVDHPLIAPLPFTVPPSNLADQETSHERAQ